MYDAKIIKTIEVVFLYTMLTSIIAYFTTVYVLSNFPTTTQELNSLPAIIFGLCPPLSYILGLLLWIGGFSLLYILLVWLPTKKTELQRGCLFVAMVCASISTVDMALDVYHLIYGMIYLA